MHEKSSYQFPTRLASCCILPTNIERRPWSLGPVCVPRIVPQLPVRVSFFVQLFTSMKIWSYTNDSLLDIWSNGIASSYGHIAPSICISLVAVLIGVWADIQFSNIQGFLGKFFFYSIERRSDNRYNAAVNYSSVCQLWWPRTSGRHPRDE